MLENDATSGVDRQLLAVDQNGRFTRKKPPIR